MSQFIHSFISVLSNSCLQELNSSFPLLSQCSPRPFCEVPSFCILSFLCYPSPFCKSQQFLPSFTSVLSKAFLQVTQFLHSFTSMFSNSFVRELTSTFILSFLCYPSPFYKSKSVPSFFHLNTLQVLSASCPVPSFFHLSPIQVLSARVTHFLPFFRPFTGKLLYSSGIRRLSTHNSLQQPWIVDGKS